MLYWFSSRQSFPLPGPGLCDSILPLAFFPSLLSSAQLFAFQCTGSLACLLWAIMYRNDRSAESPTFIMVSNLCGSSNFMVQNEQGQQHCCNFSCHALTFQMIAKLTFIFLPPSISLIVSITGCLHTISLPFFGKESLSKDKKERNQRRICLN